MNKILRNLALAAVVAAPCTAMAEVAGTGTEADPYIIATAADLQECWKLTVLDATTYFEQTADIDMTGITQWHAFAGWDYEHYTAKIVYNGNNHVIKNFTNNTPKAYSNNYEYDGYAGSIFGVFIGTVKNLGIVDVNITSAMGAGAIGGYVGHNVGGATIENVYVTGKINASTYHGGLMGTNGGEGEIIVKNCFANVEVSGSGYQGGLVGRLRNPLNLTNVYVAGTVAASETSALVAASDKTPAITCDGVVAFNTGATATLVGATATGDITLANTEATKEAGLTEVKGWAAYSSTETIDGYPAFEYPMQGSGTEEDPYIIATAEDLCNAHKFTVFKGTVYFKQTADIDMTGIEVYSPIVGYNNPTDYTMGVVYDGQNHLISNFAPVLPLWAAAPATGQCYGATIFGVAQGEIKNLGVVDADCCSNHGTGILGGYGGYHDIPLTVSNVFVSGKIDGTGKYNGGMFGCNDGEVSMLNCYANVEIVSTDAASNKCGGLIGRASKPVTLAYCYVAGTVPSDASLVASGSGSVTIADLVVFNTGSENTFEAGKEIIGTATMANTEETKADGIETVAGWDGYQDKLYKGYPALEWQTADLSGIRDIAIDAVEANGPAVYYNLQGVQVANPENGIYIVRRGNKVTKELVK